ncbi:MAG: sensor histidine kinase [Bacteroidetes bacterium]|nr:sensor histidine kinase [Bacteroidota bacterium]
MRSILFVFIIQILWSSLLVGQSKIDSLIMAGRDLERIDKVKNLINISRQYFIQEDTAGIRYALEAIDLSREIDYHPGVGMATLFLALNTEFVDTAQAIKYFMLSSDTLLALNHDWAGYGYENAARIYQGRAWYPEALDAALKALRTYEIVGDSVQYAKTASAIGYINDLMQNYRESVRWQKKALTWLKPGEAPDVIGLILGRIDIAYDELKIYDSAHFYNDRAIQIFDEIEDYYYLSQWYSNKANTYMKQGEMSKAEEYLKQALQFSKMETELSIIYINLGKVYLETNRYQQARKMIDSAIYRSKIHGEQGHLSEAYFRKYELYKKLDNDKLALDNYILYSNLKDSLLNEKKSEQVADMRVRYETEQKEKQLLAERAEKERLAKEKALADIRLYNRNKWIVGISSISLIIILSALAFGQKKQRKIQAEKDAAIIMEREKGIKAVFDAQEEERQRIAKDLHDGMGQQISAVKIHLQGLKKVVLEKVPGQKNEFDNIVDMVSETGSDIRTISHQMMPRALTELGLVAAFEDMLEKSFKYHKIEHSFEHHGMEERFAEHIEIGLYRIAQELVNNIIKHSGAGKVDVQLMKTAHHCVLIVEDDGKGISSVDPKDGIGMMNINTRLRTLNGEMDMESDNGKGTTATIRIALT